MSPEMVKEMPYNHTSDLWSLGVILYELVVGKPPFYSTSIYSLVHLIVQEDVVYPDTLSESFVNFLQGLFQKDPNLRTTWPCLLHHSFVKETEKEQKDREKREGKTKCRSQYFESSHKIEEEIEEERVDDVITSPTKVLQVKVVTTPTDNSIYL